VQQNFDVQQVEAILRSHSLQERSNSSASVQGSTPQTSTTAIAGAAPTQPFPFQIHYYDTIASTNIAVWELLRQGNGAGTVAIARQQAAGRGQWGRQWLSPPGGLYLSLALLPDLPIEQGKLLTLSSAWGVATALRDRGIPVQLKWLNDLVVRKQKLGGILTETRLQQGRITHAVIGVGINWKNLVPATGINLDSLSADPERPIISSLEELTAIVLQGIVQSYSDWLQQGTESLIAKYQTLLVNMHQIVELDGCPGEIVGISTAGNLRVCLQIRHDSPPVEVEVEPGAIHLGYE
jgi:BirA family transcriptional regulator, biotin operon repressor / biotin---[acetyl-CoA-carboxylase] ligase